MDCRNAAKKSFKVWKAYKGYIIYVVIMLIVLAGIKYDVTGYVRRVPNAEDVQDVYVGYSYYGWNRIKSLESTLENGDTYYYDNSVIFKNKENINNVISLHKQLIKDRNTRSTTGNIRCIIYTLKNGKHIIRQYKLEEEKYLSY